MGKKKVLRGDRLRQARLAKGFSQDDLQDRMGVGPNQINRYENGKFDPSMEVIVKLSETLEVSVDWLLGLVDEPNMRLRVSDLSAAERRLINAYRSREIQEMLRIIMDAKEQP